MGLLSSLDDIGRAAVRAAKATARVSPYDLPPGSDPRYLGAAPDRTSVGLLRYGGRGTTPRVERALSAMRDPKNPVRQQMMRDIETGRSVGENWYNTEELRDWFINELGPDEGHRQWGEFMDLVGATSPGSKVPANVRNASAVRQRLYNDAADAGANQTYRERLQGVTSLEDARELARGRPKGYGHKTQGLQEQIAARQQQGRWAGEPEFGVAPSKGSWTENPKPKGFAASLKGSPKNIAADLHFTRYMAMASNDPDFLTTQAEIGQQVADDLLGLNPRLSKYMGTRKVDGKVLRTFNAKKAAKEGEFDVSAAQRYPSMWSEKPNAAEYRDFEDFMHEVGSEIGMTGPQTQAALWMGAADRTGVDVTSQGTFMELLRNVADKRAAAEGLTREQVLRRFIRDKGLLSAGGAAVGSGLLSDTEAYLGGLE